MANVKHIEIDGVVYDVVPSGSYVTGVKGSNESTYRSGNVNLSKTNVGLGNVPNVTTNNQTPTFAQASTRDNLVSGEKLSVLFGKIMKWFADLKTVAFTGAYSDLSGLPTIPNVNNATLTIQKNGVNVQTFTANASSNKTANITVPTKTSELTNDSSYIANSNQYGSAITSASGLSTSGIPFKIGSHVFCDFTSGTSFTEGSVLGTLPSGYRPSAERTIGGVGCVADGNLSTIPCYFTVKTNGQIVIHAPQSRTYYYCTGHLSFVI